MIQLTRLSGDPIIINSEFIMLIEKTPDTVVTMRDGTKILVKEAPEEIADFVIVSTPEEK